MPNSTLSNLYLVLASGNKGKLAEFSQLLAPLGWQVQPQSNFKLSEAEETGLTFVENALIKARHAAKLTGLPALADDSGLEVDALFGAPGIYSARYAEDEGYFGSRDEANNAKLLTEMQDVPAEERTARFYCVLVYMRHARDATPQIFEGRWEGSILDELVGENGFGYDPLFFVSEVGCSAASLEDEEKNVLSHRAQARSQLSTNWRY